MEINLNDRKNLGLELDNTSGIDPYVKGVGLSALALVPQIQAPLNLLSIGTSLKNAHTWRDQASVGVQCANLGLTYFCPKASLIAGSIFRIGNTLHQNPTLNFNNAATVLSESVYIGANLYKGPTVLIISLLFQASKEIITASSKLKNEYETWSSNGTVNKQVIAAAFVQIALGTFRGYSAQQMLLPMLASPTSQCAQAHLENSSSDTMLIDGFEKAKLSDKQLEQVNVHIKDRYNAELIACEAHQPGYISSATISLPEKNQEFSFNSSLIEKNKGLGDDYYQRWQHYNSSLHLETKNQKLTQNFSSDITHTQGKYSVQIIPDANTSMRGHVVETWENAASNQLSRTYDGTGRNEPRPEELYERHSYMEELLFNGINQLFNGNTTKANSVLDKCFEQVFNIVDSVPRLSSVKELLA